VQFNYKGLSTNTEDIDIFTDDPLIDGLPDTVSEPTTNDFDIFQVDVLSYFQLMSQMTLNLSVGSFGTQYEDSRTSSYDTLGPSTQVPETQSYADTRHEHPHRET
jgi:hypothetical protein